MECMFAGAWHFNSDLQQLGRVALQVHAQRVQEGVRVQRRRERLGRAQTALRFENMFEDARSFNCDLGAWKVRRDAASTGAGN